VAETVDTNVVRRTRIARIAHDRASS
jgi:hypothetical protein